MPSLPLITAHRPKRSADLGAADDVVRTLRRVGGECSLCHATNDTTALLDSWRKRRKEKEGTN